MDDPELARIRDRKLQQLAATAARPSTIAAPIVVTDATFEDTVRAHPLVLVDVWAPWCGPCRALHPILEELARDMAGQLVIAKLNSDENQRTAFRFNVMAIPTMLLFHDGELVAQVAGVAPKQAIREWIEKHAAA